MKNLLFLLLITALFSSCDNNPVSYYCIQGTIRILNKEKSPCSRGGGDCNFRLYLYDGKKAYWCNTDKDTWDKYNIQDTLHTLVITETIKIK